jgi:hydroxymethylpyrimidine pyrophosphatase-like HAD family hydrolase
MSSTSKDRKLPFQNYWFICDLDGTLVPSPYKQGGQHLPLTHSPCHGPISNWIQGGGNLAVISTAGTNLFRQILHPLTASKTVTQMKGALVLCGFSGAVMFRLARTSWEKAENGNHNNNNNRNFNNNNHTSIPSLVMEEVSEYRYYGGPNGTTTCISNNVCQEVFSHAIEVYRRLFDLFEQDESRVMLLSKRYQSSFKNLLEKRKSFSDKDAFNKEFLNEKTLTERSRFVDRDPLICFQSVPRAEKHSSSSYTFEEHGNDEDFIIAQISFLGVPAKLFPLLFLSSLPSEQQQSTTNNNNNKSHSTSSSSCLTRFFKEKLGLKVVCQPNSVAIVKLGVDKGSAIQWMLTHPEGFANISPLRCLAVGDQPRTVDATMLRFSSRFTVPFFNVGKSLQSNELNGDEAVVLLDDAPLRAIASPLLPSELRLAIENGGFIEFGTLLNAYDEKATALLFMFTMEYLEAAAATVQKNLLNFTSKATIKNRSLNNNHNSQPEMSTHQARSRSLSPANNNNNNSSEIAGGEKSWLSKLVSSTSVKRPKNADFVISPSAVSTPAPAPLILDPKLIRMPVINF